MLRRQLDGFVPASRAQRLLTAVYLLSACGKGLYTAVTVLYLVRVVGLSPTQVGFAVSAAGVCGLVVSIPLGQVADRLGPRRVAAWISLTQGAVVAALVVARSFPLALLVVALLGGLDRGGMAVKQALVSRVMGPESRVRVQAYLRSVLNVGISVGALGAVPALALNSSRVYALLILTYAVALIGVAALILMLVESGSRAAASARRSLAAERGLLQDRTFLLLGLLNGLLALHIVILDVALPLWVIQRTQARAWVIPVLLFTNTVLAVLFQVRASRGADTVDGAARALRRASVVAAAACLLFVPSAWPAATGALPILLMATVVLTVAELLQSAGGWGLSFGLAPPSAEGKYLGAFSIGYTLQDLLGPLLVVALVINGGSAGWLGLAVLFLVAGALVWRISSRQSASGELQGSPG